MNESNNKRFTHTSHSASYPNFGQHSSGASHTSARPGSSSTSNLNGLFDLISEQVCPNLNFFLHHILLFIYSLKLFVHSMFKLFFFCFVYLN